MRKYRRSSLTSISLVSSSLLFCSLYIFLFSLSYSSLLFCSVLSFPLHSLPFLPSLLFTSLFFSSLSFSSHYSLLFSSPLFPILTFSSLPISSHLFSSFFFSFPSFLSLPFNFLSFFPYPSFFFPLFLSLSLTFFSFHSFLSFENKTDENLHGAVVNQSDHVIVSCKHLEKSQLIVRFFHLFFALTENLL